MEIAAPAYMFGDFTGFTSGEEVPALLQADSDFEDSAFTSHYTSGYANILSQVGLSYLSGGPEACFAALQFRHTSSVSGGDRVGLLAGPGLSPIRHYSADSTTYFSIASLVLDNSTDITASLPFRTVLDADNDTLTIGSASKFRAILFTLSTLADVDADLKFEYSNTSGGYTACHMLSGLRGFTVPDSVLLFDEDSFPTSWGQISGTYRIRITRQADTLGTAPVFSGIKVAPIGSKYYWNQDGNIYVKGIAQSGMAKGSINVGTGTGTASLLAVGTDGQMLVADSTQAAGLKWTNEYSGKVLGFSRVDTTESTASVHSTMQELATTQRLTITVATSCSVIVTVAASGYAATAGDAVILGCDPGSGTATELARNTQQAGTVNYHTALTGQYEFALTPGTYTFKLMFRTTASGTQGTFRNRSIEVKVK